MERGTNPQRCLVTGANRGLGLALVGQLLARGSRGRHLPATRQGHHAQHAGRRVSQPSARYAAEPAATSPWSTNFPCSPTTSRWTC
ncbi:MAG TPA: hypothetical protein VET30_02180 [Pseudoxanthomonas sp.]|nr:hypothetical protein [Pseudoxanthomonas sp.]